MKDPLISVIVPAYKVESYIVKCLDSICSQTYLNLEILVVEDKSPDKTLVILKEYERTKGRIQVIEHSQNRGLSAARNTGLKRAKGEYCFFVDSDDFILDLKAIEKLYKALEEKNTDIAMSSVAIFNLSQEKFVHQDYLQNKPEEEYKGQDVFSQTEVLEKLGKIPVTAWAKLFKLSLIRENNLVFPEGLIFEDNAFTWDYLLVASKGLCVLREPLYFYNIANNINLTYQSSRYDQVLTIANHVARSFHQRGQGKIYKEEINFYLSSTFIYWQKGTFQNFSVGLLYFKKAQDLFKREEVGAVSGLPFLSRQGILITKNNAFLGYFYFGFIQDSLMRAWVDQWKKTYLAQFIISLAKLFIFSVKLIVTLSTKKEFLNYESRK